MNHYNPLHLKLFFCFLIVLFSCFFVCSFISTENNIYYWDYKEYYLKFVNFSCLLKTNMISFIDKCRSSIAADDYNASPIFLPCFLSIFGTNRVNYILIVYFLYFIPSAILVSRLLSKEKSILCNICVFFIVIFYTPFLAPVLRGYPDICGIIFILMFMIFFINSDIHTKITAKNMMYAGLILYIPFLFRRWYIYSILSIYLSFFIVNILWHQKKQYIKNIACNIFISGITTAILIYALQYFLLLRILETNYSYIYSAYSNTFLENIVNISNMVPTFFVLMFIFSSFVIIVKKDKLGVFCLVSMVFLIISFSSTQSFDIHHLLPVSLFFLIVLLLQIRYIKNNVISILVLFIFSVLSYINFQSTFFNIYNIPCVTQKNKYLPLTHENYYELVNICNTILSFDDVRFAKVSFFCSSSILNESMAETIIGPNIIRETSQVDRRDGIAIKSLFSKYAVVTDTNQTHLGDCNQYTIIIPNEKIFNNTGIGKAYKRISGPYALSKNCNAYIYKKIRVFSEDEIYNYLSSFPYDCVSWQNKYSEKDIIELRTILYR